MPGTWNGKVNINESWLNGLLLQLGREVSRQTSKSRSNWFPSIQQIFTKYLRMKARSMGRLYLIIHICSPSPKDFIYIQCLNNFTHSHGSQYCVLIDDSRLTSLAPIVPLNVYLIFMWTSPLGRPICFSHSTFQPQFSNLLPTPTIYIFFPISVKDNSILLDTQTKKS